MDLETAVGHPLKIHGITKDKKQIRRRVSEMLERVGLAPAERFLSKYPGDLSGGQAAGRPGAGDHAQPRSARRRRVSMLDMSVRAKILELMGDLKQEFDLTYLYITHDLATARFFCDRIAIMYLGRIVELGPSRRSTRIRGTRTPSRCCGPFRSPTRRRRSRATSRAARCLTP